VPLRAEILQIWFKIFQNKTVILNDLKKFEQFPAVGG